jgi:hypothetical protein
VSTGAGVLKKQFFPAKRGSMCNRKKSARLGFDTPQTFGYVW